MNEFAISVEGLTRDFTAVRAVDSMTFDVPAGIVFGFLGPNGSGKTTTIRLLLGLLMPSAGSAQVLGFDAQTESDRIRERTGALLEHAGLYERLSAEENLDYYGRIYRLSDSDRKTRIQELLTSHGLWERRKEKVGTWSRGMKQKLAVARAMLHRPALLFLDEPTAGLDPVAASELREHLARLVEREGVTIFLTTHILSEAEKLCGKVGVIREGRLVHFGTTDEMKRKAGGVRAEITGSGFTESLARDLRAMPDVKSVTFDDRSLQIELVEGASLAPFVTRVVAGGAQVEEVRKGASSLEEAFLALLKEPK